MAVTNRQRTPSTSPAPRAEPTKTPSKAGCSIRDVLDRIGDAWSVLVIVQLDRRAHRFGELHRAVDGISQRMLTETLRRLERDGLISRTVQPTRPPTVEYALTDLGDDLTTVLRSLADWSSRNRDRIAAARATWDAEH